MTNSNPLSRYIKDFKRVCAVSDLISQVCKLQKRPNLEKILLNKWACTVLDSQKYEECAFIMARGSFRDFLKSGVYFSENEPTLLFLLDTLLLI